MPKIKAIKYKVQDAQSLGWFVGFQLVFDGLKTQMFESDNADGENAITVKLPRYDKIAKISVKVVEEIALDQKDEDGEPI